MVAEESKIVGMAIQAMLLLQLILKMRMVAPAHALTCGPYTGSKR